MHNRRVLNDVDNVKIYLFLIPKNHSFLKQRTDCSIHILWRLTYLRMQHHSSVCVNVQCFLLVRAIVIEICRDMIPQ